MEKKFMKEKEAEIEEIKRQDEIPEMEKKRKEYNMYLVFGKRKHAKGPNPLSVKKRKITNETHTEYTRTRFPDRFGNNNNTNYHNRSASEPHRSSSEKPQVPIAPMQVDHSVSNDNNKEKHKKRKRGAKKHNQE